MKEGTRVLVALGAAAAVGIAIALSGNQALVRASAYLTPIGTLWINAIRMTVIPLVVSLLITGVASAADLSAVGRLGARTLLVFVLLLAGTALVIIPLAPLVFSLLPPAAAPPPLPPGAVEAAGAVGSDPPQTLAAWLTSLLPSNPIAAAATGAMVPLILFTILFALAIARSAPPTRDMLVSFFRALGDAMMTLVRWVVLLAPIGVFGLVLPLAARSGTSLVGGIGFYIVAYLLLSSLATLLLYPVVRWVAGIPIRRFARAALPGQLIGFSSSSSIASLPGLIEGAERELALPTRITGFVLPLAVGTFKIAAPVSWSVGALFVGWFYGIPVQPSKLAIIAFAAVFLAFAAPGVPRGAFIMLTPLFLAIGLPPEGIGILIAVDVIPDVFATVHNVTGDLAATAIVGRSALEPSLDYGERRDQAGSPTPAGTDVSFIQNVDPPARAR